MTNEGTGDFALTRRGLLIGAVGGAVALVSGVMTPASAHSRDNHHGKRARLELATFPVGSVWRVKRTVLVVTGHQPIVGPGRTAVLNEHQFKIIFTRKSGPSFTDSAIVLEGHRDRRVAAHVTRVSDTRHELLVNRAKRRKKAR